MTVRNIAGVVDKNSTFNYILDRESLEVFCRSCCRACLRFGSAELVLSEAKISNDLLDSGIVCGVQGCTLAHDQETLEVP